jgi:hypothetical protein
LSEAEARERAEREGVPEKRQHHFRVRRSVEFKTVIRISQLSSQACEHPNALTIRKEAAQWQHYSYDQPIHLRAMAKIIAFWHSNIGHQPPHMLGPLSMCVSEGERGYMPEGELRSLPTRSHQQRVSDWDLGIASPV